MSKEPEEVETCPLGGGGSEWWAGGGMVSRWDGWGVSGSNSPEVTIVYVASGVAVTREVC